MVSSEIQEPPSFATGTRLFVYALAVAYAVAFGSIWIQWRGLIGPSGILPAEDYFNAVHAQLGAMAWYDVPSLCWIFGAGHFISVLCCLGIVLSVLLFLRVAPALCLLFMWACYLSLVSAGQIFFDFQWDALLLESTLVAIFLVPWTLGRSRAAYDPPKLARYLVWWLLFRLMFLSGSLKLTGGDPPWRHLTALTFHYQTQPLPTPLAWYVNLLPVWLHVGTCATVLVVEIAVPFLIVFPRRARHWGTVAMIALQVLIALTGNYAFFNLLTIGLCLTCLDDGWWRSVHWGVLPPSSEPHVSRNVGFVFPTALRWFAAFAVGVTFFEFVASLYPRAGSSPIVHAIESTVGPFQSFNDYGLFRRMTVERPELIFEGSDDGRNWLEYELPYKPGNLGRRPGWVAPYQPRLDWQLWFAALGPPEDSPWVGRVCELLMRGDPDLLALFSKNPFPSHPPTSMRVIRYRYEFTDAAERERTGNWWRRTPLDFYLSPVALTPDPR